MLDDFLILGVLFYSCLGCRVLRPLQACFMSCCIPLDCVGSRVLWRSCIGNVKAKGEFVPVHSAIQAYGGMHIQLHTFLTSALDIGEWSDVHPGCIMQGESMLAP